MSVKESLDAHTIVLGNVIQSEPCSHYPGYQRFFSRAAGIFGVGRRPTHLRETGNRARKVSGTQGMQPPIHTQLQPVQDS